MKFCETRIMLTPFIDTREPVSGSVDGSDGFASLVDWLAGLVE